MRNIATFAILIVITAGCASQPAPVNSAPVITSAEVAEPNSLTKIMGTVSVLGGVSRPGRYNWTNGMTVLDAIQAAGGFHDFATGVRVTHADGTHEFYKCLRIID